MVTNECRKSKKKKIYFGSGESVENYNKITFNLLSNYIGNKFLGQSQSKNLNIKKRKKNLKKKKVNPEYNLR